MRELQHRERDQISGGQQSLVDIGQSPAGILPLNLPLDIEVGGFPVIGVPAPGVIPGPGGPRRRRDS
ncbi:MAG: hypothetical protein AAF515_06295 [Pseudomonadota bacterium]